MMEKIFSWGGIETLKTDMITWGNICFSKHPKRGLLKKLYYVSTRPKTIMHTANYGPKFEISSLAMLIKP